MELFDVLDLPRAESSLSKVVRVGDEMTRMGLRLIPRLDQGELDSPRRIVLAGDDPITSETFRIELANRETDGLELKSSLIYDHNRARAQSNAETSAFKSEEVLHSSLKTIAAFLTSVGGILFVGVDDTGKLIGIQHDYRCMTDKPERQNADGWELTLRGYIRARFKDGDAVNDYVQCTILELEELPIARLQVSVRRQLSFLQQRNDYILYRRQGNQTVRVTIDQVEEFLGLRRSSFA